jgi:hypothetical protein
MAHVSPTDFSAFMGLWQSTVTVETWLQGFGVGVRPRLDHRSQGAFAAAPVGVGVGGDDLLIDHVRDLDREYDGFDR